MSILLGCIADDFTGATDLAGTLVKQGLRTVQIIDDPHGEAPPTDADAVVIALKSRTSPVEQAVRESLSALDWLRSAGCRQYYFKYCSTFDSTPKGNIGPVAEALMDAIGAEFTIACPAFPDNRRTIYQGYLFVGSELLNESSMRHHPLTPMSDANLIRVLGAQVERRVGLIDLATVRRGPDAIRERVAWLREEGFGFAVADAISNQDLETLGEASGELKLLTGASGLVLGLPANFRRAGVLAEGIVADALPKAGGLSAVIAGSCSAATLKQVAVMQERRPALRLDLAALQRLDAVDRAMEWAADHIGEEPVLIYSTAAPEEVKTIQERLGEAASALIETTLAEIARGLVNNLGVRRLIVAGGETSGAVVKALGIRRLQIGSEICPGVPWTAAKLEPDGGALALALKSGNFGAPDFFLTAWSRLP
jgi:uncharacterized protein YgbK (DUF1537 family)